MSGHKPNGEGWQGLAQEETERAKDLWRLPKVAKIAVFL